MFGKENDTQAPMPAGGDTRGTSILAQGCRFKGEVEIKGTFRVEGEFEGSINNPESLVVGKTGIVKGNLSVKSAIIGGKVLGNITAHDKVELQGGSHVEGDIKTRRLIIDEGVVFEGNCSMGKRNDERQTPPASPEKRHMATG